MWKAKLPRAWGTEGEAVCGDSSAHVSSPGRPQKAEATPSESCCLLPLSLALPRVQVAAGRERRAACPGRSGLLGSELEWPHLPLILMAIGNVGSESLEPLAWLLAGRGFLRALGSLSLTPPPGE